MATSVILAIVAIAVTLFNGGFSGSAHVIVVSPRAGLVTNVDAKVKMRGVAVGKVASIHTLPGGRAELQLAMNPAKLQYIPANVDVSIASTTVFGAKYVQLIPPARPSPKRMHDGQTLTADHVTVEINSIFEKLTAVLSKVDPAKLNETLGAISSALNGRGTQFGRALSDLDHFLARLQPGLPALSHDLEVAPTVVNAYADAAPDLLKTVANASRISQTIVDERSNLDTLLMSAIGLGEVGNDVLSANRQPLADVARLLVPTTDLTNRYSPALYCTLAGMVPLAYSTPQPVAGALVDASFTLGHERFRYPGDLPKVAATGGPQCVGGLPNVPFEARPPYVVADVGINPSRYGNSGILLNSDALKTWLFGPIDGPPRNSAQIGQPG